MASLVNYLNTGWKAEQIITFRVMSYDAENILINSLLCLSRNLPYHDDDVYCYFIQSAETNSLFEVSKETFDNLIDQLKTF